MELKRLQLLLNRAADSRLAKLKESSRTELPRQTGNSAETFSTIIKVFPPSNLTYEHDLQNRRKDVKQQTDFDSLPAFHRSYYSTLHGLNHLPIWLTWFGCDSFQKSVKFVYFAILINVGSITKSQDKSFEKINIVIRNLKNWKLSNPDKQLFLWGGNTRKYKEEQGNKNKKQNKTKKRKEISANWIARRSPATATLWPLYGKKTILKDYTSSKWGGKRLKNCSKHLCKTRPQVAIANHI